MSASSPRSVCVVGAGAVGGTIGARLAAAGVPTSALARGATLAALRRHGWRLREPDGRTVGGPVAAAAQDAAELGPHDLVVVATKAQALPGLAPRLRPLLGPGTAVVPALNGVPWWFFHGFGGALEGSPVQAVDPGGAIAAAIPAGSVVGCVVHFSASVPEPGLAALAGGNDLILGRPGGDEAAEVVDLFWRSGFRATGTPGIQAAVWYKLWGNLTTNPISALTGATADRILDDELVHAFAVRVMDEAAAIGDRIGCPVPQTPQDRMRITRGLGALRTSMLQDAEAGRPLELDAIVSAVRDIGAAAGVPTPEIDTLLGLTRLAARVRGLY